LIGSGGALSIDTSGDVDIGLEAHIDLTCPSDLEKEFEEFLIV
jgi:hypothetical protein